jgi:hypothetical protein
MLYIAVDKMLVLRAELEKSVIVVEEKELGINHSGPILDIFANCMISIGELASRSLSIVQPKQILFIVVLKLLMHEVVPAVLPEFKVMGYCCTSTFATREKWVVNSKMTAG